VGKNALPVLFHLLKKLTEPDEYIDSLELILKLVKSKADSAAKMNTQVILEEMAHVEFLLDFSITKRSSSLSWRVKYSVASHDLEQTIQDSLVN
jgi:hypothetical protein